MQTSTTIENYTSRDAWLCARRRGLGGSDVPAILGLSSYATPLSVWASKTENEPERASTYSMRRGHYMERFIADELAANVAGLRVERLAGDTEIARRTNGAPRRSAATRSSSSLWTTRRSPGKMSTSA